MQLVIKMKEDGRYLYTTMVTVEHSRFARIFRSEKSAEAYASRNGLKRNDYTLEGYNETPEESMTREQLAECIRRTIMSSNN